MSKFSENSTGKNGTIKSYANKTRNSSSSAAQDDDFSLGIKQREKPVSNFDHMSAILKDKGRQEGEIFLIDGDVDALKGLIKLIEEVDSQGVRVGVLFRADGHTTPFCIEKKIDEDSEEETMCVYHTDSVVMDIDQGDLVRELVKQVSEVAPVYSLGFEDKDKSILRDFKRQSDIGSCATYSLFDVEEMIKNSDFSKFVEENNRQTDENDIFDICALPPAFMSTIQSIDGKEDMDETVRNGLKYFINNNNIPKGQAIEINGEITNLVKLMEEIEEEKIPNPVIDIMNEINLQHFNNAKDEEIDIYHIDNKKLQAKKGNLEEKISRRAAEEFEMGYDSEEESLGDADYLGDPESPSKAPEEESILSRIALIATSVVVGAIILETVRKRTLELQEELGKGIYSDESLDRDFEKEMKLRIDEKELSEGRDNGDISDDEFVKSAFAQGSNTAQLLQNKANADKDGHGGGR